MPSIDWSYHLAHLIPFVIAFVLFAIGTVAWLRWERETR